MIRLLASKLGGTRLTTFDVCPSRDIYGDLSTQFILTLLLTGSGNKAERLRKSEPYTLNDFLIGNPVLMVMADEDIVIVAEVLDDPDRSGSQC